MPKYRRMLSLTLVLLMMLSLFPGSAFAVDGQDTYSIVIRYQFEDGTQAAPEWTAKVAAGSHVDRTVPSPAVVGYAPDRAQVELKQDEISADLYETVTYFPAPVNYTVRHYRQNIEDDRYTLWETEIRQGYTGSAIADDLARSPEGFTALNYDKDISVAADGSTVIDIYYDRCYYLLKLDLNGGYGAEPVYARYGAAIQVSEPVRPGYTFRGWSPALPETMPAGGGSCTAQWEAGEAGYLVQYWLEDAEDPEYNYDSSEHRQAPVGSTVSGADDKSYTGFHFDHADRDVTVSGDGTTVVNVYYKRNTWTLRFANVRGALTCTKTEHTHSNACCSKGGTGISHWRHNDKCCKLGLTEHTHSDSCYNNYVEFTNVKYGEDTTKYWDQAPSGYLWYTTSSGSTFYTAAPDMPNGDLTIYGRESSGSSTIHYYEEGTSTKIKADLKIQSSEWSFTSEDYIAIPGFTYSSNRVSDSDYYLYYTRNNYDLDFNSGGKIVADRSVPYEAALSDYYFTPGHPDRQEAGAYRFDGWYYDPGCTDAVDWAKATMPHENTILYAKWSPVTHRVTFAKTEGAAPEYSETVLHGSLLTGYTPSNEPYTFIGWFYRDEEGEEHAFDLSMPVVRDMALYAEWRTDVLTSYVIHYRLDSADGEPVAEDLTGSALAMTTKTFQAKTGEALYAGYRQGYFPLTSSHSILMEAAGGNEFTFVYVPRKTVSYTVRYLEKGTDLVLHEEKTAVTSNAIITEKFIPIAHYAADAYQKQLVLSAEESENVLTFWYVKDEAHAPLQIIHWIQNPAGDGYTEYQSSSQQGLIGKSYSAQWQELDGFHHNREKSNASGTMTTEGLILNLYYDRDLMEYTFYFKDALTGRQIADPVTGSARFGAQAVQTAKAVEGYRLKEGTEDPKALLIGTGANEFTFYYTGFFRVVHVQGDRVSQPQEVDITPSVLENGYDLTEQVPEGYLYGGGFADAGCETVYPFAQGESGLDFTPEAGKTYYIWEVAEKYLAPKTFCVWLTNGAGQREVVGLYLLTPLDRQLYREAGFLMDGQAVACQKDGANVAYGEIAVTYTRRPDRTDLLYLSNGIMQQDTYYTGTTKRAKDPGYIAVYELSEAQFAGFREGGFSFQAYWITLDGVRVTGTDSRACTYQENSTAIGVANTTLGSRCTATDTAGRMTAASICTILADPELPAAVPTEATEETERTEPAEAVPEGPEAAGSEEETVPAAPTEPGPGDAALPPEEAEAPLPQGPAAPPAPEEKQDAQDPEADPEAPEPSGQEH